MAAPRPCFYLSLAGLLDQTLHAFVHISSLGAEFFRLFFSVVTRPDQGAAFADFKAPCKRRVLESCKFIGMGPALDRQVVAGRLQILTDGENVRIAPCANVIHQLIDLLFLLANPHHDPGLGDKAVGLELLQDLEASFVSRLRPHGRVHAIDRFHVVADDFRPCVTDGLDILFDALEIAHQDFNTHLRTRGVNLANRLGPDLCASIWEVVAVDAGDHHVLQADFRQDLGHPARLIVVGGHWFAGLDVAEAAASCARIAQNHDGRRTSLPALAHIGATGFLADGVQFVFLKEVLEFQVALAAWHPCAKPIGLLADSDCLVSRPVIQNHSRQREAGRTKRRPRSISTEGPRVSRKRAVPCP